MDGRIKVDADRVVSGDSLLNIEDECDSIGAYLARQRELRGISIPEFAELTRIPIRSLDRLEAGHFDHASDGFARGFVRTVASALGLDAEDTLARMQSDEPVPDVQGDRRRLILRRTGLATALVLSVAAFVGIVRAVSDGEVAEPGAQEPAHIFRHDPVRGLAEGEKSASLP